MEREFNIDGRKVLVAKTRMNDVYVNLRPHIEISVRKQILDRDGEPNGYHYTTTLVPERATWAQIEATLSGTGRDPLAA